MKKAAGLCRQLFYVVKQGFFYIVENLVERIYKKGRAHYLIGYCVHTY